MNQPASASLPGLFRAGDIGVSSEWRDISYDWSPVLTPDGVFIYSYLRDTYDQQRSLRPFILTPEGPTKKSIQLKLGLKTPYAMEGPEYLLCTVGLLHIEVSYRSSSDPERPNNTHVTYYVVGRLDHPVLDWPMLERTLDALQIALAAPSSDKKIANRQKLAAAALRSLGKAGLFQNCDPEDLFYPFGAWPTLLPTLIEDVRWSDLFSHLHGEEATLRYRRAARAWVEYVRRSTARLNQENQAIGDQLLAAQRRGPRGGGSAAGGGEELPTSGTRSSTAASQIPVTSANKPIGVTQIGFVTNESLESHQPIGVTHKGLVTQDDGSQQEGVNPVPISITAESLAVDQLTLSSSGRERIDAPTSSVTHGGDRTISLDNLPPVEPHLRDAELASTRYDAYFWSAINQLFSGTNERYTPGAGEKQAVFRHFKRQEIPSGVILAALRAVMTLPSSQRPLRFGEALKLDIFHACVQEGLALLPTRTATAASASTWPQFLQSYRSVGQAGHLRNVSATDYHVLHALFAKQPNECWDVLNRVERASHLPNLSPAYLRRAIVNNQREAIQQALLPVEQRAVCGPDRGDSAPQQPPAKEPVPRSAPEDLRSALLRQEGVPATILTDDMTEDYIRRWIAEADARQGELDDRRKWLRWGIKSGKPPMEHKQLPPAKRTASAMRNEQARTVPDAILPLPAPMKHTPAQDVSAPDDPLDIQWRAALGVLQARVSRDAYDTWIRCSQLLLIEGDAAVLGTPNVFVRDVIERDYRAAVEAALRRVSGRPLALQVVIGT